MTSFGVGLHLAVGVRRRGVDGGNGDVVNGASGDVVMGAGGAETGVELTNTKTCPKTVISGERTSDCILSEMPLSSILKKTVSILRIV